METHQTIDPFGSEGIEINLTVQGGRVVDASPRQGYVNQYALFDPNLKTSCEIFNRDDRIKTPLLRKNGLLSPISINEAIDTIKKATHLVQPSENGVFVSPKHTNEFMYVVQKWARCGLKTDTIKSFRYLSSGTIFNINKNDNVPLHELEGAKQIFVLGTDLNIDHAVVNQLLQSIRINLNVPVTFITSKPQSNFCKQADRVIAINDSHAFIRAVNHRLLAHEQAFGIFIQSLAAGFDAYKEAILNENYEYLLNKAGVSAKTIETFADEFIAIPKSVIIVSEKITSEAVFAEINNLMLLTEKQAKPSAGTMFLKSECNCQGLFDMGVLPCYGPGFRQIEGEYTDLLQAAWKTPNIPIFNGSMADALMNGGFKNLFIFGEDPLATHQTYSNSIKNADFVCVQALFENETTAAAHLVLPMNFGIEVGGSYASSFRVIQNFKAIRSCPFGWSDYLFLAKLHQAFGLEALNNPTEIFLETAQFFETGCCGKGARHVFRW